MSRQPKLRFPGIALLTIVALISCNSKIDSVYSSRPKHMGSDHVKLERLHDIDVTQISLFSKENNQGFDKFVAFDDRDRVYILDSYESKISIFDGHGQFMKSFGKSGQGPAEFVMPNAILVYDGKIYVYFGWLGGEYKVFDLDGNYLSHNVATIENRQKIKPVGSEFYILRGKVDRTFTDLEFILTVMNESLTAGREIFRQAYPPGLGGPDYDFIFSNWILISDTGEFYYPEDLFNKYSLIKYDGDGRAKLRFGRKYAVAGYSKEARDRFNSIYEKQIAKRGRVFPKSPPVVANMFRDEKKNVWIVSGETFEDNMDPNFENTVDIFDQGGEWLYSFKSRVISKTSIYHNGKIYRVLPINLETFDQYIEVYKIGYIP